MAPAPKPAPRAAAPAGFSRTFVSSPRVAFWATTMPTRPRWTVMERAAMTAAPPVRTSMVLPASMSWPPLLVRVMSLAEPTSCALLQASEASPFTSAAATLLALRVADCVVSAPTALNLTSAVSACARPRADLLTVR